MKTHGRGPCPICDNDGEIQEGDISHIMDRLLEDGDVEEVKPGEYRLVESRLKSVLERLEYAGKS